MSAKGRRSAAANIELSERRCDLKVTKAPHVARSSKHDELQALMPRGFPRLWESTDLVVRSVFKTAEAFARGLVGSIPTLSRHGAILP